MRLQERTTGQRERERRGEEEKYEASFGEEERGTERRELCGERSVGKINMLCGATGRDNQSCLTLVSPWCRCVCVVCVCARAWALVGACAFPGCMHSIHKRLYVFVGNMPAH